MSQPVIASAAVGRPSEMPWVKITSYQNSAPYISRDFQAPIRHQRMKEMAVRITAISSLGVPVLYLRTEPRRLRISATASIPEEMTKISMPDIPHG